VKEALATPGLALAPITPEIALESSRLPGPFHGDPVDRIIVATARRMGAQLMTRDQKLIQYGRKGHSRYCELVSRLLACIDLHQKGGCGGQAVAGKRSLLGKPPGKSWTFDTAEGHCGRLYWYN